MDIVIGSTAYVWYNGLRIDTLEWLTANADRDFIEQWCVFLGDTREILSVADYLAQFGYLSDEAS